MKFDRLTSTGRTSDAAISPDGKYVVYVTEEAGRQSLWLRHLPTNSDKEIIAPAALDYRGLIFSHDSYYIYFIGSGIDKADNDKADDGLYKVTVLGGGMRRLSANVGSSASNTTKVNSITLSPDDSQVAFRRPIEGSGETAMIVMKTDGTEERKLLTRGMEERVGEPGWSPDGKTIVCSILNMPASFTARLVEVNVEDGNERELSSQKWWKVGRIAWLRDGRGFVMTASDQPLAASQVWFVSYPDGKATSVTSDLNGYYNVSLTADSSTMVAMQDNSQLNLCSYSSPKFRAATPATAFRTAVIPIGGGAPLKVFNLLGGPENDFGWTSDSRALTYIETLGGVSNIWSQPLDGGQPKQLTNFKSEQIYAFDWSRDGKQLLALHAAPSNDAVIINDFK